MTRRIRSCDRCHRDRPHQARGLCASCYTTEHLAGRHEDWELTTYTNAELLDEWAMLREQGYTRTQAAGRLGIARARLDKAIERARKAA